MYCRHCGGQLEPDATHCPSCGISRGSGGNFCANCGAPSQPGAVFCTNCGCQFAPEQANYQPGEGYYQQPQGGAYPPNAGMPPVGTYGRPLKSKMAAGLLGIFFGALGVHNFYLGYTTKGVVQLCLTLLTCGALGIVSGIWGFIEGILLLTGSIAVDGEGFPLSQ